MENKFTKENVEYYWKLLNTSQSVEEKKVADEYLRNFKQDPICRTICVQLLESSEQNSHFLAALILQQLIREKVNEIMENKQEFDLYKDLLFNRMLNIVRKSPSFILERICFSISILISIGLKTFWPDAIEEMINFAKINQENCYLVMIILEDLSKELSEINISHKNQMIIKNLLKSKLNLVQEFILMVITNITNENVVSDIKIKKTLYDLSLKLTYSWIQLGLNVLKDPLFSQILINQINADNIKNISDIFVESICKTNSSKYYSVNEIYDLQEILSTYDEQEMNSINNIVSIIKTALISFPNQNFRPDSDEFQIYYGLSSIFSSIMENYINLLFYKTSLSQSLLEIFFVFISNKHRKISYSFFESINELREFINRGYKFSNFTEEEKVEFGNYLMKILESVMLNCKLSNLNINMKVFSRTDVLSADDYQNIQESKEDSDDDHLGLNDYRKAAEDVFYNIFLIFTYNFGENGAEFFFNWVNNILNNVNLSDINLSKDINKLLVLEIVVFVVKSILDAIEVSELRINYVSKFCSAILNSSVLSNDHIVIKFLLFLEQASPILANDINLLSSIFSFLINLSSNELLQNTSCYVLLGITDFIKTPIVEGFKLIYHFYNTNYDNLNSLSVIYLSNSLCNLIGVLDKECQRTLELSEDEIIDYLKYVLIPPNNRITKVFNIIINEPNLSDSDLVKLKSEISKNYSIHNEVLKKAYFLTKHILRGVFFSHMNETLNYTELIFKLFSKDTSLIKEICKIYIKGFHHMAEECEQYFDKFNEMILNAYLDNCDNFTCINLIRVLYSEVAKHSSIKKDYVSKSFFNVCDIINRNIFQMKKNKIDLVEIYASLFINVLEMVDYLIINQEVLHQSISLFLEALKGVSEPGMNKLVIRLFNKIFTEMRKIPKEITYSRAPEVISEVFLSCDHYETSSALDFAHFVNACITYDENVTLNTLLVVFQNPKFKFLKQHNVQTILRYFTTVGRQDIMKLKSLLNDLINISKGMGQVETFIQYEMDLVVYDKKNKI